MQANDYQKKALRTANLGQLTDYGLLEEAVLGLCGESGEVSDIYKKAVFQGHPLDKEHLAKELGDIAWYLAVGAYAIGYDLDVVLRMNIAKLEARYPNGFDAERSMHRAEGDI